MNSAVCVLGDTAVDLIIRLPEKLQEGRVLKHEPTLLPGGSGAKTAVALSRLGIETHFIGTVGNDPFGRVVINDFKMENVGINQLFIEDNLNTVCVFAFINHSGERYLWGWPLENQSFSLIDFNRINLEEIMQYQWLHTTGLLLGKESSGREAALKLLEWARKIDLPTSLDLNLRSSKDLFQSSHFEAVMCAIDHTPYILGSEEEFSLLDKTNDWKKAVKALIDRGKKVVVRRGSQGSLYFSSNEEIYSPAFSVQVKDTVGAGDVYNAGFITGLINQKNSRTALIWGNAVAAYSISSEGARACPTNDELLEFMQKKEEKV